jgi:transcriptional regulator with XRE-family HTH domain
MSIESLGAYIKRLRKQRGLTQDDLAQAVGVTKAYICIIERSNATGRDVAVSPAKLELIAQRLGVAAEEIFNRAGILPEGTVLVRNDDGDESNSTGKLPLESIRDWEEICAAGYSDLPDEIRDEIRHYIEFRAKQVRDIDAVR